MRANSRGSGGSTSCSSIQTFPTSKPGAGEPVAGVADRGEVAGRGHPRAGRRRSARRPRSPRAPAATRRRCPRPPHWASITPPGRSAANRRCEQPLVVEDPVEGRVREDRVDRLVELELEQVRDPTARPGRRTRRGAARACSIIDSEPSTPITRPSGRRSSSRRGHPPAAAAGVEHGLAAGELEASERPRAPTPPAGRRPGRRSRRPTRPAQVRRRSRVHGPQLARPRRPARSPTAMRGSAPVDAAALGGVEHPLDAPRASAAAAARSLLGRPGLALDVLRPLVVADGDAAGVGEQVGHDLDPALGEDRGRPPASSARWRPRRSGWQSRSRALSSVICCSSAAGTRMSQGTVSTASRPTASPPGKPRRKRCSASHASTASTSSPRRRRCPPETSVTATIRAPRSRSSRAITAPTLP